MSMGALAGRWPGAGAPLEIAVITSVTVARTYNLGNYESLRLEATASVQAGNVSAAYDEARTAVEAEHARQAAPQPAQRPSEPPASDKQLRYIAHLQDDLCWTSEQLAVYANEHGVDLAGMTLRQASAFINGLKQLAEEKGPPASNGDLPF